MREMLEILEMGGTGNAGKALAGRRWKGRAALGAAAAALAAASAPWAGAGAAAAEPLPEGAGPGKGEPVLGEAPSEGGLLGAAPSDGAPSEGEALEGGAPEGEAGADAFLGEDVSRRAAGGTQGAVRALSVREEDGHAVISYTTRHESDWDYVYQAEPISIAYPGGAMGSGGNNMVIFDWDGSGVHGDGWSAIEGARVVKAPGDGEETAEVWIPLQWFDGGEFTVSGGGLSASFKSGAAQGAREGQEAQAGQAPGEAAGEAPGGAAASGQDGQDAQQGAAMQESAAQGMQEGQAAPEFNGIAIDGSFQDWGAVTKTALKEPEGDHNVSGIAWAVAEDGIYAYIEGDRNGSASWAGPNHNGKFAITTDLGRTLVFQLTRDGAESGAEGVTGATDGSRWEVRIPASSVPQNNGGLNFGLYLMEPSLSVAHAPFAASQAKGAPGISYDGSYADWDAYPHTEIQYATAGTHEGVPDGEAAVFMDGQIYGHCMTQMQAHLDERGGEFTQAVSVLANGSWDNALYMRLAAADSEGRLDWSPKKDGLDNGTYEYYIFASDAWGTSETLDSLAEADVCYGRAMVTVQDGRQDIEWHVDPAKLAARYGWDAQDIKEVSVQYGRIGQQMATAAGTPTGGLGGIAACALLAAIPLVAKMKSMGIGVARMWPWA